MYQNRALVEALARDRVIALRQCAPSRARRRSEKRRHRVTWAARRGTGWLLVDIGLRLAVPRSSMSRPAPRGRR